jgi:hypothetical protein
LINGKFTLVECGDVGVDFIGGNPHCCRDLSFDHVGLIPIPMEKLMSDVLGLMEKEDYKMALAKLNDDDALPPLTRKHFQRRIEKIETNIFLVSILGSTEDFKRLIRAGTLDASPTSGGARSQIPVGLCAKAISAHSAAALSSSGIECLDVRGNSRLVTLPVKALCSIDSLTALECDGCTSLRPLAPSPTSSPNTPPLPLAEMGGEKAMAFCLCMSPSGMNSSQMSVVTWKRRTTRRHFPSSKTSQLCFH